MHTLFRGTLVAAMLVCLTPLSALAESKTEQPDQATREAAARLVEQRYQGQMHERLQQGMTRTLLQSMPQLKRHQNVVKEFVEGNTDRDELTRKLEELYAQRFTADELDQLTEFYKTDVGQKTLQTVPEIEQGAMRWSMKRLQQNSQDLRNAIQEAQGKQKSGGQSGLQLQGQGQGQGQGQSQGE